MERISNTAKRRAALIETGKANGAEPGLQQIAIQYEAELRQRVTDGKASEQDIQTLANLDARQTQPQTP